MSTTDDIMVLAAAWSAAIATRADAAPPQDELRAAVTTLVAERDLAIHEQDVAQESLRRHEVWLQEAQAERDSLRQDAERYRWLRAEAYEAVVPHGNRLNGQRTAWITKLHPGQTFDAAIDAAMGEQK